MYRVKGLWKFMNKKSLIMLLIKLLMMPEMWILLSVLLIFSLCISLLNFSMHCTQRFQKAFSNVSVRHVCMNCFCIKQILGN